MRSKGHYNGWMKKKNVQTLTLVWRIIGQLDIIIICWLILLVVTMVVLKII